MGHVFWFIVLLFVLTTFSEAQPVLGRGKTSYWNKIKSFVGAAPQQMKPVPVLTANDFHYVNHSGPLSKAQFFYLRSEAQKKGKPLEGGTIINVTTPDRMIGTSLPFYGKRITGHANGAFENQLLSYSNHITDPQRVIGFRVHRINGEIETLPDQILAEIDALPMDLLIKTFDSGIAGHLGGVIKIEVAIVNPLFDLNYNISGEYSKPSVTRRTWLELSDIIKLNEFRSRIPSQILIEIKTITPNGFYYSLNMPTNFVPQFYNKGPKLNISKFLENEF